MKKIVRSILSIIKLGILYRDYLSAYNTAYSTNYSFVKVPFLPYVIVNQSTEKRVNEKLHEKFSKENLPQTNELPNTPVLNWNPNKDSKRILNTALDYRAEISSNKYASVYRNKLTGHIAIDNGRGYWRSETMRQIRKAIPGVFKGKILEVGAGTGLISSVISQFQEVNVVYCLDYDSYTVNNLMPLVQWSLNANSEKIIRVIGSYNKMDCEDDSFDTIIAVGAMHHSEDIQNTMNECFRVLKPGGRFIISDYALTGSLTQEEYSVLMDKPLSEKDAANIVQSGDIKNIRTNKSISEHARPSYIYQAAAFNAGFNLSSYFFDATKDNGGSLSRLMRRIKSTLKINKLYQPINIRRELGYDVYGNVRAYKISEKIHYPLYAANTPSIIKLIAMGDKAGKPLYDNMVLILEKPANSSRSIPYRYQSGNVYEFPVHLQKV